MAQFRKRLSQAAVNSSEPQFRIMKGKTRGELAQLLAAAAEEGWTPIGNPAHARPVFNESFHPFFYQPAIKRGPENKVPPDRTAATQSVA